MKTLAAYLAAEIDRYHRAKVIDPPHEWGDGAAEQIKRIQKHLPSGSGIDCGTKIYIHASTGRKIIMSCEFHHMNDCGMYDGWTSHRIVITPAFDGFDVTIGGRNRNDIKEYLAEVYSWALSEKIGNDGSFEYERNLPQLIEGSGI